MIPVDVAALAMLASLIAGMVICYGWMTRHDQ